MALIIILIAYFAHNIFIAGKYYADISKRKLNRNDYVILVGLFLGYTIWWAIDWACHFINKKFNQ